MLFHLAAPLAGVILQLTLYGIKGIADSYVGIFVGLILVMVFMRDHQLGIGHTHFDPHLVQLALMLMGMGCLDGDPATQDVVIELLQLGGLFTNPRLDGSGRLHVAKGDL